MDDIIQFLQKTYRKNGKQTGIIAVSGGIDSAASLTLLTRALGPDHVYGVLLPYGDQSVEDSKAICAFNKLSEDHVITVNIKSIVDAVERSISTVAGILQSGVPDFQDDNGVRRGNVMARSRMIVLYDFAKRLDALVCGTENKSEKSLAYFTRFGDEASDIEPIQHLYKTQVRALAQQLGLPDVFLSKAPSAGLWEGQTDETELGFTYAQADRVLTQLIDQQQDGKDIHFTDIPDSVVQRVVDRVHAQHFKHQVPYKVESKN